MNTDNNNLPRQNNSLTNNLLTGLIVTLATGFIMEWKANENRIKLEKEQFESTLITNSIDYRNLTSSRENVKFLIESELISRENEKLLSFFTDTTFLYSLELKDTIIYYPKHGFELGQQFLDWMCSGRIVDENGNSIQNVTIEIAIEPRRNEVYSRAFSDKNGMFSLPVPFEHEYIISFKKDGYVHYGVRRSNSKSLKCGTTIQLKGKR